MRLKLAATTLIFALAATTAQGANLSGMGANIFGNYFNFNKANLEKPMVTTISAGGFKMKLQGTKLADIQKRFGGTVMSSGDGGSGASWICYHTGDANTWFLSNALGGQEFLMMVAVEAASKMPGDCVEAADGFTVPDLGIPGLGASTADLKAAMGAASGSKIVYRSDRAGGYADIAQYIGYVMKGGKVAGIGIGETSIPSNH